MKPLHRLALLTVVTVAMIASLAVITSPDDQTALSAPTVENETNLDLDSADDAAVAASNDAVSGNDDAAAAPTAAPTSTNPLDALPALPSKAPTLPEAAGEPDTIEATVSAPLESVTPAASPTATPDPTPTTTPAADPAPVVAAPAAPAASSVALGLAGPSDALLGDAFELQLVVPDGQVAGYETHIGFDTDAVTFIGARLERDSSRLISPVTDTGVALAVFSCAVDNCGDGQSITTGSPGVVTLRFATNAPGDATLVVSGTRLVDAAGNVLADGAPFSHTVSVEASGTATTGTAAPWTLAAPRTLDTAALDQTGDGLVLTNDVTEAVLGWRELRWQNAPCRLDVARLTALDIDSNGCLDISDVQAMAGAMDSLRALPRLNATQGLFVVDTTADTDDADLTDLVCADAAGDCSLRAAIAQANWKVGSDRIEFDIAGAGPHTISLTDRLPTINDPTGGTIIDGYSQPGATANTDPLESNADIRIQIEGEGFSNGVISFTITGPDNEIWGIAIYDSWRPFELLFEEADGNIIAGNFIGTDAAGTFEYTSGSRGDGLNLNLGPDRNQIGVPTLAGRNVISGNGSWGMRINHGETSQNRIQNNIIGLTPDGTDRLEQRGGIDVQWWTWGNLVGGSEPLEHNVFSGHTGVGGIDFSHSSTGNQAVGNYVGTDLTGDAGDVHTANSRGISIKDNPVLNHIEGNIIGNSLSDGIWHKHNYTGQNTFVNNSVGVGINGGDIGNGRYGMHLTGHNDIYYGNTFANSGNVGIYISDYNDTNPNHSNYPPERTAYNEIHESTFFNNGGLDIDIDPIGVNPNDPGDVDTGVHDFLNFPVITDFGDGELFGTTCPGCTVEVYIAGTVAPDGTVDPNNPAVCSSAVHVEAEDAVIAGDFVVVTDAAASGGEYVEVPDTGAGTEQAPSGNYIEVGITVATAGDYVLFGGVNSPDGGADSFWVTVDDTPTAGYLWDTAAGNGIVADQVSDRTLGDITYTLTAGVHTVRVYEREDGTGLDWLELRCADGANAQTWLNTVVADSNGDWSLSDTRMVEGTTVTALAIDLDGDTSELTAPTMIVGTAPGGAGNGTGGGGAPGLPDEPPDHESFVFTCNVDENDLLTWNDPGVSTYYIREVVGGVESYLTSVTGFELQLQPGAETMIVQYFRNSQAVSATCDGPGPVVFECSVAGFDVSWTDNGASTYYVRQIIGGVDTYLGSTANTTFGLPGASDTIRVFYWANGVQVEAQCPGPDPVVFECSVTGLDVSWTDVGASTYYVRQIIGGVDTYVGSTANTTFGLPGASDTIRVFYWFNGGQVEAQCPGPDPVVFDCSVTGFDLTWTDAGASTYYIRQIIGGVDTYVGSSTGTSYTLPGAADTIRVFYWANGSQVEAQCPGPVPISFDCSVTGLELTWSDVGASTYYIREIIGGVENYLGSSTTLSYTLPGPSDTVVVLYWVNGSPIETSCNGPV